jgi:autotransporter translocation and assembly factor TamB
MRIVKRLVHALVIVLTLIVGAAAAAIIVSQTAWFKNWLRGYIVREANQYLNGTLTIERLGGNLFFGVEMENIGISMDGEPVVAVKDLGLDYNVFELLTRGLSVDNIRLDKPVIYLRRHGDTWSLSRLVKKQETEAERSGPGRPVAIEDIGISDGAVVVEGPVGTSGVTVPKRFEHLDAKLSFKYEPVHYSVEITHVSFRGSDPAIALNALSGGVSVKDDTLFVDKLAVRTAETSLSIEGAVQHYITRPSFNLQISSDKLSIPEIARLVPSLAGVGVQPAFELRLDGPLDRLGVDMNVRSSAGQLTGKLVADVLAPGQAASGRLSIRHLNLEPILNDRKQRSDINADAKLNVRASALSDLDTLRGDINVSTERLEAAGYAAGPANVRARLQGRRVDLDAKVGAYGASATASGRVTLPDMGEKPARLQTIPFDVRGQIRGVDLRKLPRSLNVPPAATDVNADYRVAGTLTRRSPGPDVDGKAAQGFTPAITADATFQSTRVAGATIEAGSKATVKMDGDDVAYTADATVRDVNLQSFGQTFNVPALADARYNSNINGHLVASGHGTRPETMNVTANGTLTDSTVMGGRLPRVTFDAALADDTVRATLDGAFVDFDPASVSGKPAVKGKVGGNLQAEAAVANLSKGVTVDSVQGTARLTLEPSTVGGLAISRASLDADYHNSTGDIRTLEIVGRDLNVRASGTLALDDNGQSNLSVHADSPSLDAIGKLVDQPLTGIAKVDAKVSGNRRQLQATGNFTGDGIKYQGNGALTASTDFTASLDNLDAATADVSATTNATFVTLAGQNINELTAKTNYKAERLDFDATARQPRRSLFAAGLLLVHADHQEVHLRSLGVESQDVRWQVQPGVEPTVQYGGDVITVKDFRLVNGAQQISAEGTFGKPGEALDVTMKDIDVATVDALLLRPPQLSGRLNATAQVTGSKADPAVDVKFEIAQGGFRQFRYDTFGGTVKYAGKGVDLDTRLQQSPTTWLTATGYAPLSDGAVRNQYDLHVDSSSIDLGLVQGFTTALTNVTGTLQAKVDVTGSAGDPRPSGTISIRKAAFNVEPTGVNYTDLEGRIDLQADKVHIDEIRVLDNHRSPLSITGELPIREREVGAVAIAIKANDFKVIDNKMGNVRINSDLRIAGQVNAPRIEGELGVSTGSVKLDPILAQIGDSAYATRATEFETAAADAQGQTSAASAFDALYAFVHLTVPNDLVIKADDLKTPGSPISLGSLNVTLGGDVTVHKAPYDQPRIYGTVNTVRGNYDFQGRRFEILRDGTVKFEGTDDLDPELDLKTQRIIQAVTAMVNVRGTLKKPEIALSSTPPLEQADILSLIVFNQPINQLGEGQQMSLAARAQGMALGAAAGQLTQSIGSALNLDTFELNMTPESGGGPQLTVGELLGQNLFVKVQQGIGDQSQTNFILEYELTKWLRFRTNVLQGSSTQSQLFQRAQGSGADMLFFFSY